MIGVAYAQGAAAGPVGGGFAQFVPLILIFIVFYFLLIRPQQKKAKEQQDFLANLQRGDKVMTGGGIHGQITGLTDSTVTLEIAESIRIKVHRGYILAMPSIESKDTAVKKG
ncbi:MAG: preprotein translocase subunit YajC [Candidatus Electrothrix sp. AW2]|jgi:preprotein translocase subunit YajC|nr:preprotein translocase subunit YajC [Candidatus Electrothrix sp. AX1]MCI5129546.1 preprotein translocase subunit YajC [Candidatus Electrothrix gigas]MCI5136354.1 preprotein translocase subunit YajC [Candidatus Electrothrix gigas]MCI5179757.1 preprotein translocase subunit YajC [Candidatus Electrothrix gigas]MCI5182107.1 preprotein translocase subunit YajC [Candidatus Electrothrix gigas]